ncbi:biotin--[acetyl-CoA-carboxylase] ligase [Sphingomonas sp. ID0503]|uniref:biotin--[acetyl-CoA-carboxylase] ligase n=1 Tax=Sphingomonas sp. ID0503 TaxID=3399691 RepID=UPI003AFA4657
MTIRAVPVTGSTNADMLALAARGEPEGSWVRADIQTGGKGRSGRQWVSPAGNLYASTLVRLTPGDPTPATLALVAIVALEEVAAAYLGAGRLVIKWPNDLLGDGLKLSGILLERAKDAVVIGFGVNLTYRPSLDDREVTSLTALGAAPPEPGIFLADLAEAFARWLARWRGEGLAPVRARWLERAHPVGSALSVRRPEGTLEGLFDGLDEDGALRLRLADGTVRVIHAADVFMI